MKTENQSFQIGYAITLFCLVFLLVCGGKAERRENTTEAAQRVADSQAEGKNGEEKTFVYECEGDFSFVTRVQKGQIWLFLPGQTVSLPQVVSASGAKFSDGKTIFWSKGENAFLETGGTSYKDCVNNPGKAVWEHAKLSGVDFRATGNEPGWYMEINWEKILFVTNYGSAKYEFTTPEPNYDQQSRASIMEVKTEGHELRVILKAQSCFDTMSGEAFETTVEVSLDGKVYRGCGRPLH